MTVRGNLVLVATYIVAMIACNPLSNPGKDLYKEHCQNCHGMDGEGLKGVMPPIKNADYLELNRGSLACLILEGDSGKMVVNGKSYDGKMPANPHLSDVEVTNILNYISRNFGNENPQFTIEEVRGFIDQCKNTPD